MSSAGGGWVGVCGVIALVCAGLCGGCRGLPEIAARVCGNGVIEAGESCDGFGRGEASCRPPGAASQCRLDCTLREDGERPACPRGWGCDASSVCRKASGAYRLWGEPVESNAFALIAGDFDGDGRADILSQEAPARLGATKFRVHYFDRDGALDDSWVSPRTLTSLGVAEVSGDARSDVVFTNERVGTLLGQADRRLISETYPSYVLPDTRIRIAGPLFNDALTGTAPLLVFSDGGGALQLQRPDETTGGLKDLGRRRGSIAELAGDPAIGDLFDADADDPCLDTVLAMRGDSEAVVYSVCSREARTKAAIWSVEPRLQPLLLAPATAIERGPILSDIDGDGHLDVLLGSAEQAYVAYGDGQQLRTAEPWLAALSGGELLPVPMPLAAGDWNGDGLADLVYASGFLRSVRVPGDPAPHYELRSNPDTLWTDALVVDLNGNGKPDIVGASDGRLDIDFYNGTGSDVLNPFVVATTRPVRQLAAGDFDGDLINDLAFTEIARAPEPSEVVVAFGSAAGPPSARVIAARVNAVMQNGVLRYGPVGLANELFIAFRQPAADGGEDAALAWLNGLDRSLMCLVELTTFASDGSVESVPARAVTLGHFSSADRTDAVFLATGRNGSELWLMPGVQSRAGRPLRLGWDLDPRVVALRGDGLRRAPELQLLMAGGDVDADGRDELVLAVPDEAREHCLVTLASLAADGGGQLSSRAPLVLDADCGSRGQLRVEDLDGDAAAELVLLTGEPGGERALLVLWNDGAGDFSERETSDLAQRGDWPQAFVMLHAAPGDRVRIAYVTASALRVLDAGRRTRTFEFAKHQPELDLQAVTGIAAGDLDGDGILDLALANSGRIQLLRAELVP